MASLEPSGKSTWRQVAAIIDGKRIPVGRGALLTVGAGVYEVTVNGSVYQRGTSKTDLDQTPHPSDVLVTEGPNAGKTLLQIVQIEGDVLIACTASPGAERPTEFTSQPGSGHALSIWLRTGTPTAAPSAPRTWRTWVFIVALMVSASLVGSVSEDLEASVGQGGKFLAGWIAGALYLTAIGLLLKWSWRAALTVGITVSVAATTFEGVKTAVAPSLGPLGSIAVSGSTALVAGFLVGVILARLFKLPWFGSPT